ncbi:hypothetical protein PAAG_11601 [Paracoccidioides lutzii Pb01]|uniref:Uncharacterized protein n=1 Tax=Paracoccidioides lutzii (strain ATCC MYA-826 / Pb01) TaxID=502779 RepID=A0A0A2VL83_PARBA|nr:hypothetical protein PAAG_11601 [Paracoccidioides lutzii Pb01]KGQ01619.1 hypothetical protein PAAG_11601 [Paracoccidioides lutzii Pb01]
MANLSQGDRNAIGKYPLNNSLSHLQDLLQDTEKFYMTHPICYQELDQFAEAHGSAQKIDWRPLAPPTQPLGELIATRKVDVGFVNDPSATEDSICRWS